jgi:hypothetical protein
MYGAEGFLSFFGKTFFLSLSRSLALCEKEKNKNNFNLLLTLLLRLRHFSFSSRSLSLGERMRVSLACPPRYPCFMLRNNAIKKIKKLYVCSVCMYTWHTFLSHTLSLSFSRIFRFVYDNDFHDKEDGKEKS